MKTFAQQELRLAQRHCANPVCPVKAGGDPEACRACPQAAAFVHGVRFIVATLKTKPGAVQALAQKFSGE